MNGCHNRQPLGDAHMVRDGVRAISLYGDEHYVFTVPQLVRLKHATSTECQYTHSDAGRVDPGCVGCCWRAVD